MKKLDNFLVLLVSIIVVFVSYKYGFAIGSTFALGLANLVVLLVYTKETKLMRKESQLMREAQTEPHISVYLKPALKTAKNLRNLILANDGMGNAKNIRLTLVEKTEKKNIINNIEINKLPIFSNSIPQLIKGQNFEFLFLNLVGDSEYLEQNEFLVNVYFESENGKAYNLTYDLSLNYETKLGFIDDLNPIEKFFNGNNSNSEKLVNNLENINNSINTLIKSIKENNKVETTPKGD